MKRFLLFAALLAAAATPAVAAVSVSVGQPGFYGRIDIGNFPQPQVIYREPIIVHQVPVRVERQPIYLNVPPGHAKHWDKHCSKYRACGQPVYFVDNNWYNNVYAPRYREIHHESDGDAHGNGHGKNKEKHHGKGHKKNKKGHKEH